MGAFLLPPLSSLPRCRLGNGAFCVLFCARGLVGASRWAAGMLYVRGPRRLALGNEASARGIVPSPARAASPCVPFRAFAPKTERLLPIQAVFGALRGEIPSFFRSLRRWTAEFQPFFACSCSYSFFWTGEFMFTCTLLFLSRVLKNAISISKVSLSYYLISWLRVVFLLMIKCNIDYYR